MTEVVTDAGAARDGWVSAREVPDRDRPAGAKFQTAKALHQQDAALLRAHAAATGGGAQHASSGAGNALAALHAAVAQRNA